LQQLFKNELLSMSEAEGSPRKGECMDWVASNTAGLIPVAYSKVLQPEDQAAGRKLIRRVTIAATALSRARVRSSPQVCESSPTESITPSCPTTARRPRRCRSLSLALAVVGLSAAEDLIADAKLQDDDVKSLSLLSIGSRVTKIKSTGSSLSRTRSRSRSRFGLEDVDEPIITDMISCMMSHARSFSRRAVVPEPSNPPASESVATADKTTFTRCGLAKLLCGRSANVTEPEVRGTIFSRVSNKYVGKCN